MVLDGEVRGGEIVKQEEMSHSFKTALNAHLESLHNEEKIQ